MEIVRVPEASELATEDQRFCEATKAWTYCFISRQPRAPRSS